MQSRRFGWLALLTVASVVAVVLVGLTGLNLTGGSSAPPGDQSVTPAGDALDVAQEQPEEEALRPSLDCAFHDFMRTRAVVSFYFDVTVSKDEPPRFYQRAIVSGDGARKASEGNDRPVWTYALDTDGKPTITAPDGETRIVLYGLKLGTGGILPVEAGIRSNEYRNLGGECRQTNLSAKPQ